VEILLWAAPPAQALKQVFYQSQYADAAEQAAAAEASEGGAGGMAPAVE